MASILRKGSLTNFTIIAAVALSVAILLAWAVSYSNLTFYSARGTLYVIRVPADQVSPNGLSIDVERWIDNGEIQLTIGQHAPSDPTMRANFRPLDGNAPRWHMPGLRFWKTTGFTTNFGSALMRPARVQLIAVTYAWLFAVAAIYPTICFGRRAVRSARARRRRHASQCPACGYDLRATPDRCPECGKCSSRPDGA